MDRKIERSFLFYLVVILINLHTGESTCTFPSSEWDGDWYDSSFYKNDVTLSYSSVQVASGWKMKGYNSEVTTWTCVDSDSTNNFLLFKGDQFVDLYGANQNAFRCIKWTKLNDYKYVYYVYANEESNAQYTDTAAMFARIYIEAHDPSVTSWTYSRYCNPSQGAPSTSEAIVMIKKGYETQAAQYCSEPFLFTAAYEYNDGSSTTCGTGSVWDVCTDRTLMEVNLTQCSTKQFYSSGGNAKCVYSANEGSVYYQLVLNSDASVDFTTTYRITCYAIETSGSNVIASDNPGSCNRTQSPSSQSYYGGGTLTFTPYITCPFTDSTTAASTSSAGGSLGIIIGAVVAVLLLIIAAVIIVIVIKKLKKKAKTSNHSDEEKKPNPPASHYVTGNVDNNENTVVENISPRDAIDIPRPEHPPGHLPPINS